MSEYKIGPSALRKLPLTGGVWVIKEQPDARAAQSTIAGY